MKKLLKLQVRNIFKSKVFYVCMLLSILLYPVINYFMSPKGADMTVVPQLINYLHMETGIIGIIFISLISCLDFSDGTMKNIIAKGYTRKQYLITKIISIIIALLVSTIVVSAVIFALYLKNGMGDTTGLGYKIAYELVRLATYTSLYTVVAIILEKGGSAIIACLFAPNIISALLGLVDSKLKLDIGKYWLDNIGTTLSKAPTLQNFSLTILYFAIYIVIIIFVGVKLFNKKEIK